MSHTISAIIVNYNAGALLRGCVDSLLACLQSSDCVGMVGGLLLNEDGTEQGGGRRVVPTSWRSFVRAFSLHRFADRRPKLFYVRDVVTYSPN